MFFNKKLSSSFKITKQKGDKYFASAHYTDARSRYSDALELFNASLDSAEERDEIIENFNIAGNKLAELNISEAEESLKINSFKRANEHLELADSFTTDLSIKEKISQLRDLVLKSEETQKKKITKVKTAPPPPPPSPEESTDDKELQEDKRPNNIELKNSNTDNKQNVKLSELPEHYDVSEQYALLVSTLPAILQPRYMEMGKDFVSAYLSAHSENYGPAIAIYDNLIAQNLNDIVLYELAIIKFRLGEKMICEAMLHHALNINPENPLCRLTLSQLYINKRNFNEAIKELEFMIDHKLLYEQAFLMLGDVYVLSGDIDNALEQFSKAFKINTIKQAAAERLIPLLTQLGRVEEAEYLRKACLKGCC